MPQLKICWLGVSLGKTLNSEKAVWTLKEIADAIGAEIQGDATVEINSIGTLQNAQPGQLSFFANPVYLSLLAQCKASAVLVSRQHAQECQTNALIMDNPYLGYARASHLFKPSLKGSGNIHPTAVVSASARIGPGVTIGPHVVIEDEVEIAAGVSIAANAYIGAHSKIGAHSLIYANVSIYHNVEIGERGILHSGCVIGADGFGFAADNGQWQKIAQLGGVRIGHDVEIGAGTTIDRGAIEDTQLGDGVIIDNQVQIAHNVVVGNHTAIAGCTAIAGSSVIGECCTIAGAVGIVGHIEITDHVHVTAMSLVTKSIKKSGSYSSGTGLMESGKWRKNVVRFRQLNSIASKLQALEKKFQSLGAGNSKERQ